MRIVKLLILSVVSIVGLLLVGCTHNNDSRTQAHDDFVKKYKNTSRTFCENGFLNHEFFWQRSQELPTKSLVTDNFGIPVTCKETEETKKNKEPFKGTIR